MRALIALCVVLAVLLGTARHLCAQTPVDFELPLERVQYPALLANFASSDRVGSAQVLTQGFDGFIQHYQIERDSSTGNRVFTNWGSPATHFGVIDPVRKFGEFTIAPVPAALIFDDSFSQEPGYLRLLEPSNSAPSRTSFPLFEDQKLLHLRAGLYTAIRFSSGSIDLYTLSLNLPGVRLAICDPPIAGQICQGFAIAETRDGNQVIVLRQFGQNLQLLRLNLDGSQDRVLWTLPDVQVLSASLQRDIKGQLAAMLFLEGRPNSALLLNFASSDELEVVVQSGEVPSGGDARFTPLLDRSWLGHPRLSAFGDASSPVSRWRLNPVQDNGATVAPAQNIYTHASPLRPWRLAHSNNGAVIFIMRSEPTANANARKYLWLAPNGDTVRTGDNLSYARFLDSGAALLLEVARAEGELTLFNRWYNEQGQSISTAQPMGKSRISTPAANITIARDGSPLLTEVIGDQDGNRAVQLSKVVGLDSGTPSLQPMAVATTENGLLSEDNGRYGQWFSERVTFNPTAPLSFTTQISAIDTATGISREVTRCEGCRFTRLQALPNGGLLARRETSAGLVVRSLFFDAEFSLRATIGETDKLVATNPQPDGSVAQFESFAQVFGIRQDGSVFLRHTPPPNAFLLIGLHADGTATWSSRIGSDNVLRRYSGSGALLQGAAGCTGKVDPHSGTCFYLDYIEPGNQNFARIGYSRLDGSMGVSSVVALQGFLADIKVLSPELALFNTSERLVSARIRADGDVLLDELSLSSPIAPIGSFTLVKSGAQTPGKHATKLLWTAILTNRFVFPGERRAALFGASLDFLFDDSQLLKDGFE